VTKHALPAPTFELQCHPATPCSVPLRLQVHLAAAGSEDGPGLLLHYTLQGPLAGLRLPPPQAPGPADGLWQHSCFEAFLGLAGEAAYREFNFSPSGQWAAYRFSAERVREPSAETPVQPDLDLRTTADGLSLRVWLPLKALPPVVAGRPWDLGLTAVIETTDGQLSYWALQHPGERPDFHHRSGWQARSDLPALFLPVIPTP
jgi:hypothetical protein